MWGGRDAMHSGKTAGVVATRVVMNPAGLAEVLRSPAGPVVRRLIQDGQVVKAEARRIVRVYNPPPGGPERDRRPGTLRGSIVTRVTTGVSGVEVLVGSEDKMARIEEEGSTPHEIGPKNAARLVFWSGKAGKVIYMKPGKKVRHPGTEGSHYLTKALGVLRSRY